MISVKGIPVVSTSDGIGVLLVKRLVVVVAPNSLLTRLPVSDMSRLAVPGELFVSGTVTERGKGILII